MTEQGHTPSDHTVNVNLPRRGSSMGIASLVLGVVAFLICWVPLLGLLGVPLSGLGLLLGVIGIVVALTRKGASIGLPIGGAAVCAIAFIVAVSMNTAIFSGIQAASDAIAEQRDQEAATNQQPVTTSPTRSDDQTPAPSIPPSPQRSTPPTPAEPKPTITWAPATAPVQQGDVQVKVASVKVGTVTVVSAFGGSRAQSKDVLLAITVALTNLSQTKKLEYETWAGGHITLGHDVASVKDNFGNRYKRVNFGYSEDPDGRVDDASLYPGETLTDVLVFERPLANVEYLNLELPSGNFGGTGMIRLRIPADMIERK